MVFCVVVGNGDNVTVAVIYADGEGFDSAAGEVFAALTVEFACAVVALVCEFACAVVVALAPVAACVVGCTLPPSGFENPPSDDGVAGVEGIAALGRA